LTIPTGSYSEIPIMTASPSRTNILKTASNLMLRYGYAATSVDDICTKAGVTKGSFYHFFGTKEELGLAVLNAFYEEGVARVANGAFVAMHDPFECLHGLFDHLEAIGPELWRHGCLMGNFACELGESNPPIRQRVAHMFEELANRLTPFFRPIARDRGEAAELAEQTLVVIEGAIIMAKAHDDPNRITLGLRRFRRAIEERIAGSRTASRKLNQRRGSSPPQRKRGK
jgi:TetR/AcrR family transcriptional repressor of nem operon